MSHDRYELVVGLEVHVQLGTRTKIFCGCSTDFGAPPNVNTCPVCLALPGALPVLNERAVELAARAALALGCDVRETSVFARKNYFYPDLPKGYQISQFEQPLAVRGAIALGEQSGGAGRTIRITRLHMEEDAGKSVHDRFPSMTAVDLNRSGAPLIEIVSEPDIRTSAEAREYLRLLKEILQYVEASEANMEEGSLRVDANVSVRRHGDPALGTRTEIKNMNSFSAVERAIEIEFGRQCALLDVHRQVVQQTMLWDGQTETVRPARSKEGSDDYRYFPEPDLRPLTLDAAWIAARRAQLPELPAARRTRFRAEYGLSSYDATVLTASRALSDYYESVASRHGDGKAAANWITTEVLARLNDSGSSVEAFGVAPDDIAALLGMIRTGSVSHTAAKRIFDIMCRTPEPPAAIAEREGLTQVGDEGSLAAWVEDVWRENAEEARRFASGEGKLLGVLVGLVMKRSRGRADPRKVSQLLVEKAKA